MYLAHSICNHHIQGTTWSRRKQDRVEKINEVISYGALISQYSIYPRRITKYPKRPILSIKIGRSWQSPISKL